MQVCFSGLAAGRLPWVGGWRPGGGGRLVSTLQSLTVHLLCIVLLDRWMKLKCVACCLDVSTHLNKGRNVGTGGGERERHLSQPRKFGRNQN
jgi:hypothetical protein